MKKTILFALIMTTHLFLFGQTATDEQALSNIVKDMANAWTNGDGEGFATHFASEHDFFVWNGMYFSGLTKERNAESHQQIFDNHYKDTKHYAVLDKIRFVTEEVVVILVMSAVVPKLAPVPEHPQVLWSATLLKKDGAWKIVSFHNADIEILDHAVSRANAPIPPEVMFKSWYSADFFQSN